MVFVEKRHSRCLWSWWGRTPTSLLPMCRAESSVNRAARRGKIVMNDMSFVITQGKFLIAGNASLCNGVSHGFIFYY